MSNDGSKAYITKKNVLRGEISNSILVLSSDGSSYCMDLAHTRILSVSPNEKYLIYSLRNSAKVWKQGLDTKQAAEAPFCSNGYEWSSSSRIFVTKDAFSHHIFFFSIVEMEHKLSCVMYRKMNFQFPVKPLQFEDIASGTLWIASKRLGIEIGKLDYNSNEYYGISTLSSKYIGYEAEEPVAISKCGRFYAVKSRDHISVVDLNNNQSVYLSENDGIHALTFCNEHGNYPIVLFLEDDRRNKRTFARLRDVDNQTDIDCCIVDNNTFEGAMLYSNGKAVYCNENQIIYMKIHACDHMSSIDKSCTIYGNTTLRSIVGHTCLIKDIAAVIVSYLCRSF